MAGQDALEAAEDGRAHHIEVADRILNPDGLRRPDEFVRHKALDAVGDLYVMGAPILGRFEGILAGHALNNRVCRALMERPSAWRWKPSPAMDLAETG